MMSEARLLIAELDTALSHASDSRHLAILRRVTELFLSNSESFSDDYVAVFDDVIGRLIEKTDLAALIELSNRMAPLANAPPNVIASLARNDNIAVAGPILGKSNALNDQALAEIAGIVKSQKHLAAIAARAKISETVTDILVERGNSEVAHIMSGNLGASISELGFVKLINRCKSDEALAAAIAKRPDIPPELEPFLKLALVP
jgi:uncharacterized protein (DUF2336 family)